MAKNRRQPQCYIVHEDSGEYDEFRSTPVVVFREESAAIAERDRRNVLADNLSQRWRALWEACPPAGLPDAEYAVRRERHDKQEAALRKRRMKVLGSEEFDGVFGIREVLFRGGAE